MIVVEVLLGVAGLGAVWVASGLRVVRQWEQGVLFRFGKVQHGVRGPGLTRITPIRDRLRKVNMQIVTMPVPAQDGITRDNVTVRVDAVVYFRVHDPVTATVAVQNYLFAVEQVAQTSLRNIIGKSDLDDLLSNRESLNKGLELLIDNPALSWGIHIERVEIKDVALPEAMKRSMSRQAEAERERRARIITADGEYQASRQLAQAAEIMAHHPAALQLRLLETVVQVAAEKNSTLVLPFPVELLRFLERSTPPAANSESAPAARPQDDDAAAAELAARSQDDRTAPELAARSQDDPAELAAADLPPAEIPPADPIPAGLAADEIPPAEVPPADPIPAEPVVADLPPADLAADEIPPAEVPPADPIPAEPVPADLPRADLATADPSLDHADVGSSRDGDSALTAPTPRRSREVAEPAERRPDGVSAP